MNPETFTERFCKITAGHSLNSFAKKCGLSESLLRQYKTGTLPRLDKLIQVADAANLNVNWLATGEGPMLRSERIGADVDDSATGGEFVHIPRYDVEASAGGGVVVESEQVVDYLSFRAEWVRNSLGVSVRDLALISVIGDSMEPTLSEGDVVLLDMTTKGVMDGSIYALQLNGGLLVKRIQRKLNGSIVVKPDNPRYDTEIISEDSADLLKIIGRVVWVGRRL